MARYEVWLASDDGRRLRLLDEMDRLRYSIVANAPGYCTVTTTGLTPNDVQRDYQLHIYRAADDSTPLRLQRVYFVRNWRFNVDLQGITRCTLAGPCQNDLLDRRIIAYAAATSGAGKSSTAVDDIMKAIVRENLGGSATAARDITDFNFSVAANTTQGPTITKGYAWKPLLQTLQELHENSSQGTLIFFDVAITGVDSYGAPSFEFRTYPTQPGVDRRTSATGNLYFSTALGNLANPTLEFATEEERNYIYAGGRGSQSDRNVQEVSDSTAIAQSRYNRREAFTSAVHQNTDTSIQGEGYERLQDKRAREIFTADLLDSPDSRYGIEWSHGDYVTVREFGRTWDGIIRKVSITLDSSGAEDVLAYFDSGAPMTEPLMHLVAVQRALEKRISNYETAEPWTYKKTTSGSDLTTTDLPYTGDYGFRTDTNQLQVNVSGVIKKITYT